MGCALGEFGYSRAMLTKQNSVYPLLSTLCAAILCACPSEEPGDGATEPSPSTATGVPVGTTDETDTSTTEDPTSTSSSSTGDETSTSSSTTDAFDPNWCDEVLQPNVDCRVHADSFCGEMELDAVVLPEPYRQNAIDKCEDDPCSACFYLANTCLQLLGEKGCSPEMYERCVCLANAHGVV